MTNSDDIAGLSERLRHGSLLRLNSGEANPTAFALTGDDTMTPTQKAVEAALDAWHSQEGPTGREQQSAMRAALTAAIAVDGLRLVEASEVEKLRSALKGLSDMYTHAWDLADGGLMMMESSMDRFEKAHQVAYDVLNPDHPLISDEDDAAAASDGEERR